MSNKAGNPSLTQKAYNGIYEKIITMELSPGQRLDEKLLMEELGIGRTPIREALLWLAGDLMVESFRNKGFIVRPILLQNTKAVFEALRLLEFGVVGLAVRNDITTFLKMMKEDNEGVKKAVQEKDLLQLVLQNSDFHIHFAACSCNEYLIKALTTVRCEAKRLAFLSYGNEINSGKSVESHYQTVIAQHEEMISALEARDEKTLNELNEQHVSDFQQRIILYMMG